MISEYTYESVKDHLLCRELDQIRVKGKKEPVRIYELLAKKTEETTELKNKIETYGHALALYREQKFEEAAKLFKTLTGDAPAQVFVGRCEEFIKTPPKSDWDGVWNFEVK